MASAESSPPMSDHLQNAIAMSDHLQNAITESARGFNHSYYQPLHFAILNGDWESTKVFLDNDPNALTAKVTMLGSTALHVAAVGGQWQLVEKLVQCMPANMVAESDVGGWTCLHYVAMGESVNAAKALVMKNPSVTQITASNGITPLLSSITFARCKEMVWYLVLNTTDDIPACPFSGPLATELVSLLTAAGFHDITMYLMQRYPNLATLSNSNGSIILNGLSKLPKHFQSGQNLRFCKRIIYHCVPVKLEYGNAIWNALQTIVPSIKLVRDAKLRHVSAVKLAEFITSQVHGFEVWGYFVTRSIIYNAASSGIVEMLRICFRYYPDFLGIHIPNEGFVAQIAIKNRQEKVFSLLCKMGIIFKMQVTALDESKNTTSHLAARFASQVESIPGAAFQMQRELQWFKEVEKLDLPFYKEMKDQDGKTPWQLFKKEHKALLEEGKNWMKDTSNSCMLVATLIATIAFAAAITVPGGNNQDKGIPIFLTDNTFMVFAVSDALALFSSMTSLLMFLAILNARFAEEDFIMALPEKLILGLASLFFAIVTTMVAFGAALSMLLKERLKWAPIPIALLACVPIILFAELQLPLFIEMVKSTYGTRFSYK